MAVAIMGVIGLVGCKGGPEETTSPPVLPAAQVGVQTVVEENMGSQIEVVGTVRAVQRASIAARVSGQIAEMPVVLGSQVQSGDLLVKISAAEIAAQVLQAKAQVEQAKRNLAREEKLFKQEASTLETVKGLRDQVRIMEAASEEVKTMMKYLTITAPFAGTITSKIASVGDLASPGVVLLEMENPRLLQVVAQVPEALILKVNKGDALTVVIPAAGVSVQGEVAEVAPTTDSATRTAPVKINITAGTNLRAGQFARVSLAGSNEKVLAINDKAVTSFGQMERVFVVEESTARLRLVRTGIRREGKVEILAGLSAGDRVVICGAEKLQDGQALVVRPEGSPLGGRPEGSPLGGRPEGSPLGGGDNHERL